LIKKLFFKIWFLIIFKLQRFLNFNDLWAREEETFGTLVACLHDQKKSGSFGGPAFFQPIRAFRKLFKLL